MEGGILATVVILVILPIVTELVKVLAIRWDWFDPKKLAIPIAGAASLIIYIIAWKVSSGNIKELEIWCKEALTVAFISVSGHSIMTRVAPKKTEKAEDAFERVTSKIKLPK